MPLLLDYSKIASEIIKHQEFVIGPVAWSEAKSVKGIVIRDHNVEIKGDGKKIVEELVNQYATLFGRASVEVCRDAVKNLLPKVENTMIPSVLL